MYHKNWYEENKEKIKFQQKKWYEEKKEKIKFQRKKWYEENKEKISTKYYENKVKKEQEVALLHIKKRTGTEF